MDINSTNPEYYRNDPTAAGFIQLLHERQESLGLNQAVIYHDFPLYRDQEGDVVTSKIAVISPEHGIIIVQTVVAIQGRSVVSVVFDANAALDHVFSSVYARLLQNKNLRKSKVELKFPIHAVIYAPMLPGDLESETPIVRTDAEVLNAVEGFKTQELPNPVFAEALSTLEGAKGLHRPKKRDLSAQPENAKGHQVAQLEQEIANFDRQQRQGYLKVLQGPQRVRGLAGSGKTVVLAMKAALTHLRDPDARIVFTFYTKSLYQHIKRLITRFYRQFDDRDPDWNKLKILHAWGGHTAPGVYFNACEAAQIRALTYGDAAMHSPGSAFEFACKDLLQKKVPQQYDYAFVDEGQDFPAAFLKLCLALTKDQQVIWAYDELQTIFQTNAPTPEQIFGVDAEEKPLVELEADIVLHKCYRNPREILVCAHALGFGLYGTHIVQMLENTEHWEDLGYKVQGDLVPGHDVEIERPEENSPISVSAVSSLDEIVDASAFPSAEEEVGHIVGGIRNALAQGLRPDDILVVAVDDRYAKRYLGAIAHRLKSFEIKTNNVHESGAMFDFQKEDHVTLSTVHKAKGNEGFMVYVVGADALFNPPTVRSRNTLFTAMTRAKAWVRVSGTGESAKACKAEIDKAKSNFPNLRFTYPSAERIKIMRRDLEEEASQRIKYERMLEQVASQMSRDEIEGVLEKMYSRSGRSKDPRGRGRGKR